MHFGDVKVETIENQHNFHVSFILNDLNPDTVQVEIFANGIYGGAPIVQKITRVMKSEGEANQYDYYATVTATRPASDYTARVIPYLPNVSVPLEISRILWQR